MSMFVNPGVEGVAQRLREADPTSLDDLWALYSRPIETAAYLITGSRDDASDVLIETMVTAWRHARNLRDDSRLESWLIRISINHSNSLRRRGRRLLRGTPRYDHVPDSAAASVTRMDVFDAVQRLPNRMRVVVTLRYLVGYSNGEIAEILGTSANTVREQLRIARVRLRDDLA